MPGTQMTVVGNIVDDVILKPTVSGLSRVSFRVCSSQRRRDPDSGQWVDGRQLFVSVTFWRDMAENVAASMKKGDPVVVRGYYSSRYYTKNEVSRIAYELDADCIGHDLSFGVAKFDKRKRTLSGTVELDPDGFPARLDQGSYELVEDQDEDGEVAAPIAAEFGRELAVTF